jgi:hypothetical protein
MCLPTKLRIEIQKLEGGEWLLQYEETLGEAPEEVIDNTIKFAKEQLGVSVEKKGKTLSYTLKGGRNAVFSSVLFEALSMCEVGDLTLREIVVLSGIGAKQLQQLHQAKGEV